MSRLRYAGLTGTVGSGGMTNSATSHTFTAALTYANGVTVPTLTGSDYFMLTILDSSGNLSEIVKVTAYNSGTKAATLVRGQEGTSGVSHSSGDKVTQAVYASDIAGKDPRWFPLSDQTSIDEFNDDSLNASWVQVDSGATTGDSPATKVSWLEGGDALSVLHAGSDANNAVHAKLFPLSSAGGSIATNDAFVTCLTSLNPTTSYTLCGLMISDGTTFGSGKQVTATLIVSSTIINVNYENWTSFNTRAATANAFAANTLGVFTIWLRLVYLGSNNWRVDWSGDGIQWWKAGSTFSQSSFTPTHVGFFETSFGSTTKHQTSYECLRRQAGIT